MLRVPMLVVLLAACAPSAPPPAVPSPAEAEVAATVQRLFDAMRAGDSTALRALFHPDARLMSVTQENGVPVLQSAEIDRFVTAVGTSRDRVFDERIWDLEVQVDDGLAAAWMDYAFFLGDDFSHCGVNAFQFFRGATGWKVIQITDTRRREGCEMPPAA